MSLILAIESSCDEMSVAILKDKLIHIVYMVELYQKSQVVCMSNVFQLF